MGRPSIPLKSRVRYEGRVRTVDRRATQGADLEKLPNPLSYIVSQVLRSGSRKPLAAKAAPKSAKSPKP